MNAVRPPYTADTGKPAGGGNYIFMAVFVLCFVITVTIAYTFYMRRRRSRSPPPPAATGDTHDHHLIRFSAGLDDDALVTLPTFVYSGEATVTHKGGTAADANDSGCSICLADYKPAEVVRILPECGHFFHVKCVDLWLKAHLTCPVCRNSVVVGTVGPTTTSTALTGQ